MLQEFQKYISEKTLFSKTDKILLTVSGGLDSVVMCDLFHKAGFKFGIAHCNFKLREAESEGDELFVASLAKRYKTKFHSKSFNTYAYAKEKNISIQMAARDLRYTWFEEIRKKEKYKYIATAHHRDDQVETLLINIVRGTGIAGLHGIAPKQKQLIRPLLFGNREQIEKYARENDLLHREDSSNASDKYVRNKIRHHVVPVLKEINPYLEAGIAQTVERLREAEEIYLQAIEEKKKKLLSVNKKEARLPVKEIKKLPKGFLYGILSDYNFNAEVVNEIQEALDGASGKQFFSATHRLIKDREQLIVTKKNESLSRQVKIYKQTKQITSPFKMTIRQAERNKNFSIPRSGNVGCFDAALIKYPLVLRNWKEGDHFFPLGMKGKKKLSDFFIDHKFSIADKESAWLLLSGKDIIWIVGHRIDERYKISAATKRLFICEVSRSFLPQRR